MPDKISNKVNADGKKVIENKEVINWLFANGRNSCFITLKDHKPNILYKPSQKRTRQDQQIHTNYMMYIIDIIDDRYNIIYILYIYISLNIYIIYPFCTPAVAHKSYFDCIINATPWKAKIGNLFVMLIIWCKLQEKNYCKLQFIWEMNPIKGL